MESWPGTEPEPKPEPQDDVHFSSKEGLTSGVRQPCSSAGLLVGAADLQGLAWAGADGQAH